MTRFEVVTVETAPHTTRYVVRDTTNDQFVRYGYNNPPLYATAKTPRTAWGNRYAALGFAQKLATKNL